MLDSAMYRNLENIAKVHSDSYLEHAKHFPEAFERGNFPIRVSSLSELQKLSNWNHHGILEYYMELFAGFSLDDLEVAVNKFIEFQAIFFNHGESYLALEQFFKCFILYKILDRLNMLDGKNILEIGPGIGLNAFFIGEYTLNYSTVEVAESFYLLQNMINSFLFKDKFKNHIWDTVDKYTNFYACSNQKQIISPDIYRTKETASIHQYPYWKIGDIYSSEVQYDVIMSNANMLEFNPSALEDYLELFRVKLAKNGILLFFCTGNPTFGTPQSLIEKLAENKFKPLCLFRPGDNYKYLHISADDNKVIVLSAYGDTLKEYVKNYDLESYFDEIYILDDSKTGLFMGKYKFVNRDEVKKIGIKHGLIMHEKNEIREVFVDIFKELSIQELPLTPPFLQTFGIFVTDTHDLYNQIDFKTSCPFSFVQKEFSEILSLFEFSKNKSLYVKDALIDMLFKKQRGKQ